MSHDLVMTPFDVVKQRMQLGMGTGMISCFQSIFAREGIRAFYLSLPTTLIMNIPYGAVLVASHESIKKVLNPDGGRNVGAFLLSGALSGILAAAVTNPLDVVKTKLQTMGLQKSKNSCAKASTTFQNNSKANFHSPGMILARNKTSTPKHRNLCSSTSRKTPIVGPMSIMSVMRDIAQKEGLRGFLRGIKPRLMVHAPATGISWGTYETVKRLIE
jgi:solute carrier family 25 (mitochondrial iron transporter), member 28/37